jgi:hypothetical protein
MIFIALDLKFSKKISKKNPVSKPYFKGVVVRGIFIYGRPCMESGLGDVR